MKWEGWDSLHISCVSLQRERAREIEGVREREHNEDSEKERERGRASKIYAYRRECESTSKNERARERESHGDVSDQCPHGMILWRLLLLSMADAHTRVDTSCYTVYSVIVCIIMRSLAGLFFLDPFLEYGSQE
jgi:hypothetical protein